MFCKCIWSVNSYRDMAYHQRISVITNYNMYCGDGRSSTSNCTRGGGVLNAVKSSYNSSNVSVNVSCVEQLFVKISFRFIHSIFATVYIPPASLHVLYSLFPTYMVNIINQSPNIPIYIISDFNLPHAIWKNSFCATTAWCELNEIMLYECVFENFNP